MKVYIVTQGAYSDYSIRKVFLDKEKAEKYAKYISTQYDEAYVEEYDTYDENFITKKPYIKCSLHYTVDISNNTTNRIIYQNGIIYQDHDTECVAMEKEFNDLIVQRDYDSSYESYVIIKYFDGNKYDKTTALKELEKIGYDIGSEILEYLKDYNLEKTFEIIYSKYKHDVDLKELEEEE